MVDSGFPRVTAGGAVSAPAGRWWAALAVLLLLTSLGSWMYLILSLGVEGNTCFDVLRDPGKQRSCDQWHQRVGDARRIVVLVAVASAVLMLLIGLLGGWRRRRFASGPRQPLRVLSFVNPAGMIGYLAGHLIGRLLPADSLPSVPRPTLPAVKLPAVKVPPAKSPKKQSPPVRRQPPSR
jgi:hypothetical protein